ncbi:hypothetical protein AKJ40_03365 [candidate division MSBL1 archaeon SCGC-AAA259M10]|uniref:Uncharacterized protein n=1 Tax=candidate division MSBL1 archaeon SCGC-AAA259M10 TaxID=1698270 RepID=A0A133UYR4_9EURY|nr:hypothetical protein AKJ40_03365 [candidate division MSBL1 archaeon SCGC-AAA259M10]
MTTREKIAQFLKNNSSKKFTPSDLKGKNGVEIGRSTIHNHLNILKDEGFVKKIGGKYAWYTYRELEEVVEETLKDELGISKDKARDIPQLIAVIQNKYRNSGDWPDKEIVEAAIRTKAEEMQMYNLLE